MGDTPDPGTGLTERQKDAVRSNWAKIAASWKTNGPEYFIRLFQTFPAIKSFFKSLDGIEDSDLRSAPKLRAHAINFKHGLASMVDNLDDVDCLIVLIHKLTDNHFRRQIPPERFQDAFTLFMNFIQEVSEVNEFTLASWKATLDVVAKVISDRMAELQSQTDGQ